MSCASLWFGFAFIFERVFDYVLLGVFLCFVYLVAGPVLCVWCLFFRGAYIWLVLGFCAILGDLMVVTMEGGRGSLGSTLLIT